MAPLALHDVVLHRLEALSTAVAAGDGRLDAAGLKTARELVHRTAERLRLGSERTVVALVGATGSGKSSLFNALAGIDLAEVGVRRPTTGRPTACIWAGDGADPLLNWLDVPRELRTNRESVLDGSRQSDLRGLVLLDLPDHDSTQVAHRLEVDRLVDLVDLLVWVVDPQKYADQALHAYLRRLSGHSTVMLVVLNQLDRLSPTEAHTCAADLRRLLDSDGLEPVPLIGTSARTGAGVPQLRQVLSDLVGRGGAFAGRALADLDAASAVLAAGVAPAEADPGDLPGAEALVEALADAAGVPATAGAASTAYRRRASRWTGWPPATWYRTLRADGLSRVGLAPDAEAEIRALGAGTSPADTSTQRDRVELAVREITTASAAGLPPRWADDVRSAAVATGEELRAALDSALRGVDLTPRRPLWWPLLAAVQVLLVVAAAVGLVWWAVGLTGAVPAPSAGGVSLASLLFVDAVGLGALLAVASRWLVQAGAQRQVVQAEAALRAAIRAVVAERVEAPVAAVLADHRTARLALTRGR